MKNQSTVVVPSHIWTLLSFAWLAQAASQVLTFGNGMMIPGMMSDLSLDLATIGKISTASGIASIIMTIPITIIAPRFDPKKFVAGIILFLSIGLFVFGTAKGVSGLYLGKIITGFLGQGIAAALVVVKVGNVPPEKMQQVNGTEFFVGPIGQIVATLFMAQFLALVNGWRNVYMVMGVVMLICAIGWYLSYGRGSMMLYSKPEPKTTVRREGPSAIRLALTNKNVWLIAIAWPCTTIVWIAMFTYWPTYAIETFGMELKQIGLVLSFIPIFSAIASLTSPMLAKKIGKDKPLIWPWGFILPFMYFGMLQTSNLAILIILSSIAGYGAYCFVPLAMTTIYKLGLPPDAVSIGVGLTLTFISIGTTIGAGPIGILSNRYGIYRALAISCLTPFVFGILTLMLPELGRKKMEELAKAKANSSK